MSAAPRRFEGDRAERGPRRDGPAVRRAALKANAENATVVSGQHASHVMTVRARPPAVLVARAERTRRAGAAHPSVPALAPTAQAPSRAARSTGHRATKARAGVRQAGATAGATNVRLRTNAASARSPHPSSVPTAIARSALRATTAAREHLPHAGSAIGRPAQSVRSAPIAAFGAIVPLAHARRAAATTPLPAAASASTRERPARADKAPRSAAPGRGPARPEESAPRPAAHRRDHDDAPGTLRLSKLMSELGLCSRREADEWIENGWVKVDGQTIDTLGSKVRPDQRIEIDPAAQAIQARLVTILIHKPVGYVSGQAEDGYQPAVTLVTPDNRWEGDHSDIRFSVSHLRQLAPAGRLDIDSTGLLVLTQDGRIAKRLIGGHSEVEKEYLVRVTYGEMTAEIDQHFPLESLELLRHGLELDDVPLKPAKVSWQNGEQLRFVLREGKKRQIRRMCELVGLEVVGLKRVRMGSVPLGALPPGQWRYLSADESF